MKNISKGKFYKPKQIRIENVNIWFVPNIANGAVKDTQILQILDALRDIKNIPDNSLNVVVLSIKNIFKKFDEKKIKKMFNPLTTYKIGISSDTLANRDEGNIR